jgi:hypothetical protein
LTESISETTERIVIMANTFAPFGLRQMGGIPGAAPNFEQVEYQIVFSDTNKIYFGDPVKALGTGYVAAWTAGTAVSQLAGTFVGCKYLSVSRSEVVWSPYWPGADATSGTVYAYIVPVLANSAQKFLVQTSNSSTNAVAVTQASLFANADVAMGTGSTVNGISGAYLDINTFNTTPTLPFRIVGLYQGVGNGSDATTAYNWVVVQANIGQNTGLA